MIPFGKTTLGAEEKKAVADCIDSGWVALGGKSKEFEEKFAEYVGAQHAVFVDSCTSALFLAVQYLKYKGFLKKLIVPSLTFNSTAAVVVQGGLELQFGDVSEKDFCLTPVGKDSLPVHLYGNRAQDGALLYDSAHRIEKGDMKGSGALWCYSFYATKNMTTVTGGMIATNDKEADAWLRKARDHGLDMGTAERYQGAYKQYDVAFVGWRVKGDDLSAAMGLEQLKKLPRFTERRNEIVEKYNKAFGLSRAGNHVYPLLVKNQEEFVNYMYKEGVQCTVHFRPVHTMTAYKKYYHGEPLPNTDFIGSHVVSIPLHAELSDEEVNFIIEKAKGSGMLLS